MIKLRILWLSCIIVLIPIVGLLLWAFSLDWFYPHLIPAQFGLKYLKIALQEPSFWPSLLNSTAIAFAVTLVTLIIAVPAAKFFAFQGVLSKRMVEFVIYMPLILPAIAIITSTQTVFIHWQLTGTFTGIILIHTYFTLPYALQILVESYRKMGNGYQTTARILGASAWQTFCQVTFPLVRPGIVTAAGLVYIVSFSQYLPTFFIGDGKIMTLPLIVLPYATNGRLGMASIYSLIFILVVILGAFLLNLILSGFNFKGGRYGVNRRSY